MIQNRKKILLYQGGRDYNQDKTYRIFKNILNNYIVDCFVNVDVFDNKDFFKYDTTIFFSQEGKLSTIQEENLLDFIGSGKGFVGLHGASASFKNNKKYFDMLGGRFINHKSLQEFLVKIVDKKHEITRDLENFYFKDEPYRHDFSMTKNIRILAEAHYNDKDKINPEPIMWIKNFKKGRIFFCSLGHRTISLKEPIFQTIIIRAVEWVLESQN
jgi:type 1 glutamine amidotransferase